VSSNTALKALAGAAYPSVNRSGFATAGDGGAANYTWSASACSMNSGAGDNGSQVAPAIGIGCWILQPANPTDIRVWGAKADNATDIGQFVQKSYAANVGCISIPAGIWLWSTAVTMTAQVPCFKGNGWNEAVQVSALNTTNMTGTWLHFTSSSFSPVTITATTGQGGTGGFTGMAFYENQPTPTSGWTPTAYPYIFNLSSNLGRIDFDNIMFYNVTHCINSVASARGHLTNIYGQPLGNCLQVDQQHDVSLLQNVEFWPFWTSDVNVSNYQEASVDPILYLRADSPTIGNVFVFGYHSGIAFGHSSDGVTSGAQITNFQGDADQYSLWIKPGTSGTTLQIGSLRTAGENWITNLPLPSSEGYRDEGSNSAVDIANLDCFYAGANCVDVTGAGRVSIGNARLWNYNSSNVGAVGMQAGTSGWISLANPPSVVNPFGGALAIPATSLGGTYDVRN
jgi:hypothetical protein